LVDRSVATLEEKYSPTSLDYPSILNNPKISHIYKDIALAATTPVYTPPKKDASKVRFQAFLRPSLLLTPAESSFPPRLPSRPKIPKLLPLLLSPNQLPRRKKKSNRSRSRKRSRTVLDKRVLSTFFPNRLSASTNGREPTPTRTRERQLLLGYTSTSIRRVSRSGESISRCDPRFSLFLVSTRRPS